MTERAEKPEKTESTWKTVGTILGIIVGVISVSMVVIGLAFGSRIETNTTDIRSIKTDIQWHNGNTGIHRTAEESREFEIGQDARWTQLFRELDQLGKRMDNIERRTK